MKGRIVEVVKRWWVMALVVTLALSLTSCSRKRQPMTPAFIDTQCNGSLGDFDIYVVPSRLGPGRYDIQIMPIAVDDPGDVIQIAVSNGQGFKLLVPQVAVYDEEQIYAGTLMENELLTYDMLAMTTYHP